MKLSLIGSIKVDSWQRKKLFIHSLTSLSPILSLISWQLNIVGKYADFTRKEIINLCHDAMITINNNDSYYRIIKNQIKNSESDFIFFWQEDHWFLCSNENLFFYLLDEFSKSQAEILTVSHLITSWERKSLLPVIKKARLYKEYMISPDSQEKLWHKYPNAYLTGMPAIYKKKIAMEMLEFNKECLGDSKLPWGYELDRERGKRFLKEKNFIEMIPVFHIFREVFMFKFKLEKRAIRMKQALQILKLREKENF